MEILIQVFVPGVLIALLMATAVGCLCQTTPAGRCRAAGANFEMPRQSDRLVLV